jgi:predicted nucleic acid-binding protein
MLTRLRDLERLIPAGDRVLLDTSALAAYLDSSESVHAVAEFVIDSLVAPGRNEALVSTITAMELLERALPASPAGQDTILAFLAHQPNLRAVPVDLRTAQEAALLRVKHRLSPPDALVAATALSYGAGHLVTNDPSWAAKLGALSGRLEVHTLASFALPE